MTLTDNQRTAIGQWIEAGASLPEIQKRLKDEFQISLTYLETRFLADDLKLALKDPEPEKKPEPAPAAEAAADPATPAGPDEAVPGPGKVTATIDQITKVGAMISGRAVFSDGEKAEWYLDQSGRLGLNAETPGYRPSQQDVMDFQMELERLARTQGL